METMVSLVLSLRDEPQPRMPEPYVVSQPLRGLAVRVGQFG
jgi:hypothetical protein